MTRAPKKTTFGPRETQRIIARRKKWVDALRSGKFQQGKKMLHLPNGCHCVMGVAELSCKLKNLGSDGTPKEFALNAECRAKLGLALDDHWNLTYMNDGSGVPKKSFPEIADVIEKLPIVKEDF